MQNFIYFIVYTQYVLSTHMTVILSYLSAGGGISVILQFVKKLRRWESDAWVEFVLGFLTSITAVTNYVINNYTTSPLPTIFGNFAPKILVASIIVHRLAVSPISKLIERKLIPFAAELKAAIKELRAEKSAIEAPQKTTPENPTITFES